MYNEVDILDTDEEFLRRVRTNVEVMQKASRHPLSQQDLNWIAKAVKNLMRQERSFITGDK